MVIKPIDIPIVCCNDMDSLKNNTLTTNSDMILTSTISIDAIAIFLNLKLHARKINPNNHVKIPNKHHRIFDDDSHFFIKISPNVKIRPLIIVSDNPILS